MAVNESNSLSPERIQLYLSGQMTETEQSAFEKDMEQNQQLRDAVKEAALATWTIKAYAQEEEKRQLNSLYKEEASVQRLNQKRWVPIIAVAATLLVLLVGYFVINPLQGPPLQDLMATYYELPQAPDLMSTDVEQAIKEADMAYSAMEWEKAVNLYHQIPQDSLSSFDQSRIYLYQGLCLIKLKKYQEAENTLLKAHQHQDQQDWYLSLIYLEQEDYEKASKMLNQIKDKGDPYFTSKAEKLLKALKEQ
ncbi:MAG: hypothetical protein AAFY71_22435 [Bacteroidota bacterium]